MQSSCNYMRSSSTEKQIEENNALPLNDELDIKVPFSDVSDEVPSDIMFPEELNRFLRGQIRALTQVNGQLLRVLEERESELQAYVDQNQRFSMTMPGLAGTSRASEMAASKIVELSKRVRELTAEVEGHKSRHRAAEAKLAQYIEASQTALSSQKKEQSQDNGEKQEDQVRMLTEKLNSTSSKLYECRNQCQQLKQDLKMAQKVLSSEIGDNVSIHSLTSGNSNWRGRAQQIIALQQKISELKERLGEHNDDKTGCNKGMTTLRQIERERRAAHEQTERELKDVNAQLEDSKKKADGARARVKILEGELASVKGKLKTILEKGSHDDQLIKALTGQVNLLEKNAKEHAAVLHTLTEKHEKERESLLQNLAEEKSKTQDMHAILLERNEAIDKLEKRLMDERETVAQYKSDKLFHSNNQESIGSCKSTAHSGETPKSPKLDGGQYQVLGLVAEAERVRLIELLAVTNRRLEEQRKKAEDAEDCLRRERQKTARLETKVTCLELEKSRTKNRNYYTAKRTEKESSVSELKDKLELAEEELCVLKTRLQSIKQEREDDLKSYANLLDQTRQIFMDANNGPTQDNIAQSSGTSGRA